MTIQAEIRESVREFLINDVDTGIISEVDGRIACATPLEYPNGDGVVVWAAPYQDLFEISDYGEAYIGMISQPTRTRNVLAETARSICRDSDVEFIKGRVSTRTSMDEIADAIWRVACASVQVAAATSYYRPKRQARDKEFANEVGSTIKSRSVEVVRDERLTGLSGHKHKATIYMPASHTVVEPVASDNWNQIASVYTKLGDLSKANGYQLFSILDDRHVDSTDTDIVNMLVQVSGVVQWSQRDDWLNQLRLANA